MDSLIKDLIVFVGRRIDKAKALTVPIDAPKENLTELDSEERTIFEESIKQEAIYLQGLADGVKLATIMFAKEKRLR